MKLNLWPPCLVIFTDDLPPGVSGEAGFLHVRLRPKYAGDQGLLRHELTHEWQGIILFLIGAVIAGLLAYAGLFVLAVIPFVIGAAAHVVLYKKVRLYRRWAEVEAYQVQMRYPRADGTCLSLDDAAWRLVNTPGYDLQLTLSEARELLKG